LIVAILAALSLCQRVIPWLLLSKLKDTESFNQFFSLFGISAFSALAVYDMQSITLKGFIPMIAAGIMAWKFRSVGLSVFVAILLELAITFL